mmetsp:Transcript_28575/g.46060  ORF Transcript_28575/g.46060 Transcript_28575/m.46060 type:complete len:434 (-) Transcript_28575:19-1320(-)
MDAPPDLPDIPDSLSGLSLAGNALQKKKKKVKSRKGSKAKLSGLPPPPPLSDIQDSQVLPEAPMIPEAMSHDANPLGNNELPSPPLPMDEYASTKPAARSSEFAHKQNQQRSTDEFGDGLVSQDETESLDGMSSIPDEIHPFEDQDVDESNFKFEGSHMERTMSTRSLSARRAHPTLSADLVQMGGVDPVPNLDSPANRTLDSSNFVENPKSPIRGASERRLQHHIFDSSSSSSSDESCADPEDCFTSIKADSNTASEQPPQLAETPTRDTNHDRIESLVLKLLEVAVTEQANVNIERKEAGTVPNAIRSENASALDTVNPDCESRNIVYQDDEPQDPPHTPVSVNNTSLRKEAYSGDSLESKVREQQIEISYLKRLVVIHSMFFKWKVWHVTRLHENSLAEMEEERMSIASRLLSTTARLQEHPAISPYGQR